MGNIHCFTLQKEDSQSGFKPNQIPYKSVNCSTEVSEENIPCGNNICTDQNYQKSNVFSQNTSFHRMHSNSTGDTHAQMMNDIRRHKAQVQKFKKQRSLPTINDSNKIIDCTTVHRRAKSLKEVTDLCEDELNNLRQQIILLQNESIKLKSETKSLHKSGWIRKYDVNEGWNTYWMVIHGKDLMFYINSNKQTLNQLHDLSHYSNIEEIDGCTFRITGHSQTIPIECRTTDNNKDNYGSWTRYIRQFIEKNDIPTYLSEGIPDEDCIKDEGEGIEGADVGSVNQVMDTNRGYDTGYKAPEPIVEINGKALEPIVKMNENQIQCIICTFVNSNLMSYCEECRNPL